MPVTVRIPTPLRKLTTEQDSVTANESGTLPLRSMGVSGTVPTAVTALESRSAS